MYDGWIIRGAPALIVDVDIKLQLHPSDHSHHVAEARTCLHIHPFNKTSHKPLTP